MADERVDMPVALQHYWRMWNEDDLGLLRAHLEQAVTADVVWADPLHFHVGIDALEANARELKSAKPEYYFVIASELDAHHDRYRYQWHMKRKHRVLMRGLDIVTMNAVGLIERVDGFFGALKPPADDASSGVPRDLRAE